MSIAAQSFSDVAALVTHLRNTLTHKKYVFLYAFNGTGKTRVSMGFKDAGKASGSPDTLYFNAFTEDLFYWDNDFENDTERILQLNMQSQFFNGLRARDMDSLIRPLLQRYADFDFKTDFDEGFVRFRRNIRVGEATQTVDYIKVSRGEQNIFIWCFFLAVAQLAIDAEEGGSYSWVKYIYIDDPISSLDDNNAIAVASHLAQMLRGNNKIKTVVSSHHTLFFNVMCNELKKEKHSRYFLHKNGTNGYRLNNTDDTPYFHHVAMLGELKGAIDSGNIKTYHFNTLRSILEKTSTFFGFNHFGKCIHGVDDQLLFERALDLLSHGKYSVYDPIDMTEDNKQLFSRILMAFLDKYSFELPTILIDEPVTPTEA